MLPTSAHLTSQLTDSEAEVLLRLRLLVARAAQPDSLRWWDDRSLTVDGGYVADRLFPGRPRLMAGQIAMATARARHDSAIAGVEAARHLFDFGDAIEFELEFVRLMEEWIPLAPILSSEDLILAMAEIVPDGTGYSCGYAGLADEVTGPIAITLSPDVDYTLNETVLQASALALAYGMAGLERPVFPYLQR